MTGFPTLLGKELLEAWRTRRLVVVGVVFLLFGIASPAIAKYTPDLVKALGPTPGMSIVMAPATTVDAVGQLAKQIGQVGVLVAIFLAMGSVASEKDRGTAALLLTMPVGRGAFLLAKLLALATTLGVGMALAAAGGWLYTTLLFEPVPVVGFAVLAILLWLQLLAFAAITFLASTVFGSQLAAGGLGFVAYVVLAIVAALPTIGEWTPVAISGPAVSFGAGIQPGSWLPAVVSALVSVAASTALSWTSFARQEL